MPVTHQHPNVDWAREAPRFRELALAQLAKVGLDDVESRIRFETMVTPADWDQQHQIHLGATFNLAHNLSQMLHLRPRNRFEDLESVYLVGGGTHPGSGLPVIYESARITSRLLGEDLGQPVPVERRSSNRRRDAAVARQPDGRRADRRRGAGLIRCACTEIGSRVGLTGSESCPGIEDRRMMNAIETGRIGVIGGGLGGLAAACTLAARGYEVVLFEKNAWLGGKAAVLSEGGYRFDMGPTILLMPSVLRRIFAEAGRDLKDELELIPLDPQWRSFFADGSTLDLHADADRMARAIDAFAPGGDASRGYRRFLDLSERLDDISQRYFFWRSIGSLRTCSIRRPR